MKQGLAHFVAGAALAVSGTIIAANTTLPHTFTAGAVARASEINDNFSSLLGAANGLDNRVSALESRTTDSTNIPPFTVTQAEQAVNATVTVGGVGYTIVQFDFPRYDTDEVYQIKYPVPTSSLNGTSSYLSLTTSGSYESVTAGTGTTTLNGFNTIISEGFGNYQTLQGDSTGRKLTNSFSQSLSARIQVGPTTALGVFFSTPGATSSGSSATRSGDASGLTSTYPPTLTAADRNTQRQYLRQLLSYVTIKKKPT